MVVLHLHSSNVSTQLVPFLVALVHLVILAMVLPVIRRLLAWSKMAAATPMRRVRPLLNSDSMESLAIVHLGTTVMVLDQRAVNLYHPAQRLVKMAFVL